MLTSAASTSGSARIRSPEDIDRDLRQSGNTIQSIQKTLRELNSGRIPGKSGKDILTQRIQMKRALKNEEERRERLKEEKREITFS